MAGLVCLKMDKHSQTADDEDCYWCPQHNGRVKGIQSRRKTAAKRYFAAIQLKKLTAMMKGTRQNIQSLENRWSSHLSSLLENTWFMANISSTMRDPGGTNSCDKTVTSENWSSHIRFSFENRGRTNIDGEKGVLFICSWPLCWRHHNIAHPGACITSLQDDYYGSSPEHGFLIVSGRINFCFTQKVVAEDQHCF